MQWAHACHEPYLIDDLATFGNQVLRDMLMGCSNP